MAGRGDHIHQTSLAGELKINLDPMEFIRILAGMDATICMNIPPCQTRI